MSDRREGVGCEHHGKEASRDAKSHMRLDAAGRDIGRANTETSSQTTIGLSVKSVVVKSVVVKSVVVNPWS
jgi:hypothetical protein